MPETSFGEQLKKEADAHLDEHLESEHFAPARTTPQGTQADGVEHGHEERDIDLAAIVRWGVVLGVTVVAVIVILAGMLAYMNARESGYQVPPMFDAQVIPPAPRLLPNPIDQPSGPSRPVKMPPAILAEERAKENQALAELGLLDAQTGRAVLPPDAAAAVAPGVAPIGPAARQETPLDVSTDLMPSDSSGGTQWENRLR